MSEDLDLEEAGKWLERLVSDRTARGTVTVRARNDVAARPRYQECRITATIAAPEFGPLEQDLECMVRRDFWPEVGDVLPAIVHLDRPERTEIDWDRVELHRARVDASRRKAARSG